MSRARAKAQKWYLIVIRNYRRQARSVAPCRRKEIKNNSQHIINPVQRNVQARAALPSSATNLAYSSSALIRRPSIESCSDSISFSRACFRPSTLLAAQPLASGLLAVSLSRRLSAAVLSTILASSFSTALVSPSWLPRCQFCSNGVVAGQPPGVAWWGKKPDRP